MIEFKETKSEVQPVYRLNGVEVSVLREDLLHPQISGNKYRKLKYNLAAFRSGGFNCLVTFGGAYSNHIYATAAAGKEFGFDTVGVIRGEEAEHLIDTNPSLSFARDCGMKFKFVSREAYRRKTDPEFLDELKKEFGKPYLLPEGGTNRLAVKGCEEILGSHTLCFDYICCAIGTGGTISGLINTAESHQKVLGFPTLKDSEYLTGEIGKYTDGRGFERVSGYHFGGFAKISDELIGFINNFKKNFGLTLDPIYTAKMAFGTEDLIRKGHFEKGSRVLMVHTGGLQGIDGMNQKLMKKKKTGIG